VEEGAVARPAQFSAGVGDRLRQRVEVERRGQHLTGAVDRFGVADGSLAGKAAGEQAEQQGGG